MNDSSESLEKVFPLYLLRIETPKLTLRLMKEDEVARLALRSAGQILPDEGRNWMGPWTQMQSPEYETKMFQYHLENIARWRPERWILNFGVFVKGEDGSIGSIGIKGEHFQANRAVTTGSWLLRDFQRKGYGREMREAALFFAFDSLGALRARSGANPKNIASIRVSSSLGYTEDGTDELPDGNIKLRFLLERKDWKKRDDIRVLGLEDCRDLF